jgi:choline kinase
MITHGILPAAGLATRLRRLPKFLLPSDDDARTLIECHIEALEAVCDVIWLPVRPDLIQLVHDLQLGQKIIPVALSTKSMTETVLRITSISAADRFILGMPDTGFVGEYPYLYLAQAIEDSNLSLALWNTHENQRGKVGSVEFENGHILNSIDKNYDSKYPLHWGAMSFDREFISILNYEMPHTGYGIREAIAANLVISASVMTGEYFDCGTFSEYRRFLLVK